ncbi:hypothetical protein [Gemmatimonas sp.]|uniref:hypothetical protein n=1 Tax=Gemmatimonas sp. TaxID=1962908 RepID=UPI00286A4B8C|nr:hypothetical protein [Gemmatimonas sp.]
MCHNRFAVKPLPKLIGALSVAILYLNACGSFTGGGDCVDVGRAAVVVTVVDSLTNQTPAVAISVTISSDSGYSEVAQPVVGSNPRRYAGAIERTGNFSIEVSAEGYRTFRKSNVQVGRGGACRTLQSSEVTAKMQVQ